MVRKLQDGEKIYNLPEATITELRDLEVKPDKLRVSQIPHIDFPKIQGKPTPQSYIVDPEKFKYYANMLSFYNLNPFGFGLVGNQTHYNPATIEGLLKIQSNFDYAKSNFTNTAITGLTSGIGLQFKGIIPKGTKLGKLEDYTPFKFAEGAESTVFKDNPFRVGKISEIPTSEMVERNLIPLSVPHTFRGNVITEEGTSVPVYTQPRMRVTTESNFEKYALKLDKLLSKFDFRRLKDENILGRAYYNGKYIIDDVAPGNLGINWRGLPRLIDATITKPEDWIDMGFSLQ